MRWFLMIIWNTYESPLRIILNAWESPLRSAKSIFAVNSKQEIYFLNGILKVKTDQKREVVLYLHRQRFYFPILQLISVTLKCSLRWFPLFLSQCTSLKGTISICPKKGEMFDLRILLFGACLIGMCFH